MFLWILAAIMLSLIPLINKKIELSYYIWILLPIDFYGLHIAGAVIKPYMVFAIILPFLVYAKNKSKGFNLYATKGQLCAGVLSILIILINLLNSSGFSTVKAAIMMVVVYICTQCYVSSTDLKHADKLNDVFIASGFGFATVFIAAYILMQAGVNIDGILAQTRNDSGIFLQMNNMSQGKLVQAYRLRGFFIDPNLMYVPFIFSLCASVNRMFKKINLYYLLTAIMSVICVILSSSRMGLICCTLSIIITTIVCITQYENSKKKIASAIVGLSLLSGGLIFFITSYGQKLLNSLLKTYSNRSSLSDEYGRFNIWGESLKVFFDKNPLFGVGFNKMSEYTATERMTHNTWLQFVCECGLIVGGLACIYFISIMIYSWIKCKKQNLGTNYYTYISLCIGYAITVIALCSVDYINFSYMWMSALLLLKFIHYGNNHEPTHTDLIQKSL